MAPAVARGKVYPLDPSSYVHHQPQRGDVVVFDNRGRTYINGILATGGDRRYQSNAGPDGDYDLVEQWHLAGMRRLARNSPFKKVMHPC